MVVMCRGRVRRLAAFRLPGSAETICWAETNPPKRPVMIRAAENIRATRPPARTRNCFLPAGPVSRSARAASASARDGPRDTSSQLLVVGADLEELIAAVHQVRGLPSALKRLAMQRKLHCVVRERSHAVDPTFSPSAKRRTDSANSDMPDGRQNDGIDDRGSYLLNGIGSLDWIRCNQGVAVGVRVPEGFVWLSWSRVQGCPRRRGNSTGLASRNALPV